MNSHTLQKCPQRTPNSNIKSPPILRSKNTLNDMNTERVNKGLRVPPYSRAFCSSSCHCDDCGKRSKFMRKVFQLYKFRCTNQWKKQKNFRKFRKLIHCIIYIIRYRIVKRIKTKKKATIMKALQKKTVIESVQSTSTIQNAISELKQLMQNPSTNQSIRFRVKKQENKNSYASLLKPKSRKNLRQLFFIPQLQSPIKQFIIKSSKPNTAQNSPMQSLYDFKMSSSFRGL